MSGWDAAAAGYDAYWVPRFAPWVAAAVDTLPGDLRAVDGLPGDLPAVEGLPEGPVLVPCCGTFPELPLLAARLPGREAVGMDLSPEMVRLAGSRAAAFPGARAVVGDAAVLGPEWTGRCAAVVSVFGLQQLPDPSAAAVGWLNALRPDGQLTIVFWPSFTEHDGPFALMDAVVREAADADADADGDVERRVGEALRSAGADVDRDGAVPFSITHPDAAAVFDAHAPEAWLISARRRVPLPV